MKNFRRLLPALCFVTTFIACKKEATPPEETMVNAISTDEAVIGERWWANYLALDFYPPSHRIGDNRFIANGYARIYSDSVAVDPFNYYSTSFRLRVAALRNIDADNITFEAHVKNPSNSSPYPALHGRDVSLKIVGNNNYALINNVTPDSINSDAHNYAVIQIGNNRLDNVTELQHLFEDWGTIVIQTFNYGVVAYRDDQYLKGLPYAGESRLGKLKEILISFKGSGYIDWVKLYNSATGDLIMSEDFNIDGQSSVVWY